jgi:hypothetical protein
MEMDKIAGRIEAGPVRTGKAEKEEPEEKTSPAPVVDKVEIKGKKGPVEKVMGPVAKTLLGGVGFGSGAVGGGIIGASAFTATNLIQGLLAHNVTLSALTAAGMTGGIIFAGFFGVCGAIGGWKLAQWTVHGAQWVYDKLTNK